METGGCEERHILTVLWRIENIGLWETNNAWSGFYSPEFIARTLEGKIFRLVVWPKTTPGLGEHIILELTLLDLSLDFLIDGEWSFFNSNGSLLVSGTMRNHVIVRTNYFKISDCPTFEVMLGSKKSTFLPHDTLTVRIRIWSSYGDLSNNEFVYCRSRFEATDYSFLWPVPIFGTFALNQEVTTPIRFGDALGANNFLLKFSFQGRSLEVARAYIELSAVSISTTLDVTLKVSVLDTEQKVMRGMEINSVKYFKQNSKETWILPNLVSRNELLKEKSKCLGNDVLTLRCEISNVRFVRFIEKYDYGSSNLEVDSTKISCSFLDTRCPHRVNPLIYLGEDLLSLYQYQRLTDFELHAGDTSFPVHKNILSARSPVFRAMFSSDMKESVSNSQDVPDLDVHTLNRLLTFLYGGTVEQQLQWEGAAKLYYAADKYQVQSLKQQCSSILRSNISVSNVSNILKLADRHQDQELTSFVYEFVLNKFDEIMQSEEWENFVETDSYLAAKTVHQLCKKNLLTKRS